MKRLFSPASAGEKEHMQYKNLYQQAVTDLENEKYRLNQVRKDLERAEGELQGIREGLKSIEARELNTMKENQWLRDTLRLVIVDAGKMSELAKSVENERRKNGGF